MTNERESRVIRACMVPNTLEALAENKGGVECFTSHYERPQDTRIVILECDKGRCGDFEEWMVRALYYGIEIHDARWDDLWRQFAVTRPHVSRDDDYKGGFEDWLHERIANAISRVLQEANDG